MIRVYVDGSCRNRIGGWAAIIVDEDGNRKMLSGRETNITSNQIELISAIKGLEATPTNSKIKVYSDSQYLIYTMQGRWKRRSNFELWKRLDELGRGREIEWEWRERGEVEELVEAHKLAYEQIGGGVRMVDVCSKPITVREAVAKAIVKMSPNTLEKIKGGELVKGDVFSCAQIAGIMAAKKTPELIPLCHPVPLSNIRIELDIGDGFIEIRSYVVGEAKTGFEMEAMVGAAIAALTIYDMAKGIDPAMSMEVKLVKKSGGKSGVVKLE